MNNKEIISFAQMLYNEGCSYQCIQDEIRREFDVSVSAESIRYHVKRKHLPKLTNLDKLSQDKIEKVLVMSDLHVPFNRDDVIDIVVKHKDEISTLILGGDIIDCHPISSFSPLDALPLVDEMIACHQLLKEIQDIIPNARKIVCFGNHEVRFKKYLANNTSELNNLHSDNILKEVCSGFDNYDRRRGVTEHYESLEYEVVDDWWVQYNDMIVCHPTTFSRVAGKTAQMALEYFVERGVKFTACLVAHTHKIANCFKFDKISYEIGCICQPQGYASSGKLTYSQQQCGYHLAVFKEGVYDFNLSQQYYLQ